MLLRSGAVNQPINFGVVCVEPNVNLLHRQEKTVRAIREILPIVLAKYGIDQIAPAEPRNWIKGSSGRTNHGGFKNARPVQKEK